jgi:hypothetical protein
MKTQERVREMAAQNYNNTPVGISGVSLFLCRALEQLEKQFFVCRTRIVAR